MACFLLNNVLCLLKVFYIYSNRYLHSLDNLLLNVLYVLFSLGVRNLSRVFCICWKCYVIKFPKGYNTGFVFHVSRLKGKGKCSSVIANSSSPNHLCVVVNFTITLIESAAYNDGIA